MKVIACGSRIWNDQNLVSQVLTGVFTEWERSEKPEDERFILIEGGAKGADTMAKTWCHANGLFDMNSKLELREFIANWEMHGKAAGVLRNQDMLDHEPDLVIGFSDDLSASKGTKDMCTRAKKAGIPVYVVSRF